MPHGGPSAVIGSGHNPITSSAVRLDTVSTKRRVVISVVTAVLTQLCHLSTQTAATCRNALLHLKTLPQLVLHITSTILHDHLLFLSAFLVSHASHPTASPQWLLAEVAGPGGTEGAGAGRGKRVEGVGMREELFADAREEVLQHGWSEKSHAHLRLYCALVRLAPLKPTPEEV